MTPIRRLLGGLRAIVRRKRVERDLDAELGSYLDAAVERRVAAGETREHALRLARAELGSAAAIKDDVRDAGWETRFETLWQDVRHTARGLRLSPAFTLAVVLTLALGIGVNVAIFTLLDVVMLRPLALPAAHELITMYEREPGNEPDAAGGSGRYLRFSYPRYQRLQQALGPHGTLAAMSGIFSARLKAQDAADPIGVEAQLVSGNFFTTLGARAVRGRMLTSDDDRTDAPAVAVISEGLWRRSLGGADTVVGQPIQVNGAPMTIVGVAAAGFLGGWADNQSELWLPVMLQSAVRYGNESSSYAPVNLARPWLTQEIYWLRVVGRVAASERQRAATLLQVANRQGLEALSSLAGDPSLLTRTLVIESFARGFSRLRAQFSGLILALMILVGVLLLLACGNVASLLLVRAGRRSREMAIRFALGATPGRIARQCLIESLLLASIGSLVGYVLGAWTKTTMAVQIMGTSRTIPPGLSGDWRIVGFAVGSSLVTALLFGLAPIVRTLRSGRRAPDDLNQRNAAGHTGIRGLRPIVAVQLALSVVVVFSATLLGRTVINLTRVNPGFEPDHLVGAYFNVSLGGYSNSDAPAVYERLIGAAQSVPGVVSASLSVCGLLQNCSFSTDVRIEGLQQTADVQLNWVGSSYFSTVGRPVIRGREFNNRDTATTARVALISESLATRYFKDRDPIGRHLRLEEPDVEIIGVVRDARSRRLRDTPSQMVFLAVTQPPSTRFRFAPGTLEIRVNGDPGPSVSPIREALRRVEPRIGISVQSMPEQVARQFERERAVAALSWSFAVLAVVLASVGLYGVLSYSVGQRTREIGVRMALGAERVQVLSLVLKQGAWLTIIGLAAGLPLAPWATRSLQDMFFEVSPFDPVTYLAVSGVLGLVAALASFLPARRATKVDPVIALRSE